MEPFTPTPEQSAIIFDTIDSGKSALVVAPPGTGKSRTAIEAARRKVAVLGDESRRQVLFLSFSNAAIHRLSSAAGVEISRRDRRRLRFMTYHSLAFDILRRYGRFVGLPPVVRVADKLEERLIGLELGWVQDEDVYEGQLTELAKAQGLLGFDLLIPLAESLLMASPLLQAVIGRRYPLIVVDEFQDTSEVQWSFLRTLGGQSQVIAFGDPNQIIYSSLHQATERRLNEFLAWRGISLTPFSGHNFRCSESGILDFAQCLLRGTAHVTKKDSGIQVFDAKYRPRLRAILAIIWKYVQDKVGHNQTIGFLAPSNSLVEQIATELRNPPRDSPIAFPVYVQMARDEAAYDAVILALAALKDMSHGPNELKCRKAAVALLAMNTSWNGRVKVKLGQVEKLAETLNSVKAGDGSPFGGLLGHLDTGSTVPEQVSTFAQVLSDQKEFKLTAGRILAHGQLGKNVVLPTDPQLSLFDNVRSTRIPKGLDGYDAWKGKTHILTYHKAKGREFDFVVMIVDPRGESTKPTLDEKRRLYYVCATRAKKWLGVVYFGDETGLVLGPVLAS